MTMTTLHYIHDPMCGWCYGATPLMHALRDLPGLQIELHGGGMMAGDARRPVTPQLRSFVMPHDRRIAELTGQSFGTAYTDGLLNDVGAVLDSGPPIAALLAAQSLEPDPVRAGLQGLALLARIQRAHYVEGRRVASAGVLREIAAQMELDAMAFSAAFDRFSGAPTALHIEQSRQMLRRAGGQGFPTVAIEGTDGRLSRIEVGSHHGQPGAWVEAVRDAAQRAG